MTPKPSEIKVNNTAELVAAIELISSVHQLKPSTKAGAGLTVYVNALLEQAHTEGIDYVRRNLDRAIELLTEMRSAAHADEMDAKADAVAQRHVKEVLKRTT